MRAVSPSFRRVNWGEDEAKRDVGLRKYFVEVPGYEDLVQGKKRFIIGRKGTGKTAIIERIRMEAEDNAHVFASSLSLRDMPLNTLRSLGDSGYRDKAKYVPVWTFLLLRELAELVLEDEGAGPVEVVDELRAFVRANFDERGYQNTLDVLKAKSAKVSVLADWLGGEARSSYEEGATIDVHFQRVSRALLKRLSLVASESTYYLLIDELDEGYRAGDSNTRLLILALLRAVEDVALEIGGPEGKFRPIAVLRSDIYDSLDDNDLNKLDDRLVRLRWHSSENAAFSLREVVDARIYASFQGSIYGDPWGAVADSTFAGPAKSLWRYICDRTFERPRDLLKFLKCCQGLSGCPDRLDYRAVAEAENDYSRWLYQELGNELTSVLSGWREVMATISKIGVGRFSVRAFVEQVKLDTDLVSVLHKQGMTPEAALRVLFEFGAIGLVDKQGRWVFRYKDEDAPWMPQSDAIVHWGLMKKLRLQKGTAK